MSLPVALLLSEVRNATSSCSHPRCIGLGGCGTVYKVQTMPSLSWAGPLAVKRLSSQGKLSGAHTPWDPTLSHSPTTPVAPLAIHHCRTPWDPTGTLAHPRTPWDPTGALAHPELQREIELLKACSHPSLLPLYGYCLDPHSQCLVSFGRPHTSLDITPPLVWAHGSLAPRRVAASHLRRPYNPARSRPTLSSGPPSHLIKLCQPIGTQVQRAGSL